MARLRGVPASFKLWQQMVTEGNVIEGKITTTRGIPEGAELVRSFYDELRGIVIFVFYHASFDDVPAGWRIPEIDIEFRKDYLEDVPPPWTQ